MSVHLRDSRNWYSRDIVFPGENEDFIVKFRKITVAAKLEGEVFQKVPQLAQWNELADFSKSLGSKTIDYLAYSEQLESYKKSGENKRYDDYIHLVAVVFAAAFFTKVSLPYAFGVFLKVTFWLGFLISHLGRAQETINGFKGGLYNGKRAHVLWNKPSSYKDLFLSLFCPIIGSLIEINGRAKRLESFQKEAKKNSESQFGAYEQKYLEFMKSTEGFEWELQQIHRVAQKARNASQKPLPMMDYDLYTNDDCESRSEKCKDYQEQKEIAYAASEALRNLQQIKLAYESYDFVYV